MVRSAAWCVIWPNSQTLDPYDLDPLDPYELYEVEALALPKDEPMTCTHQTAAYARSALGPRTAGSTTLERQVEACRRYADAHNLTVDSDLIVADTTP